MANKFFTRVLLASIFMVSNGCSSRSWYEGFREMERQKCYEMENPSEMQECLERVDGTSYDQYQRAREESKDL
jgi:hypothetical protein